MTRPVGRGEYEPPGHQNYTGRNAFLRALRFFAPGVLNELVALSTIESAADRYQQVDAYLTARRLTAPGRRGRRDDWLRAALHQTGDRWRRHPVALEYRDLAPLSAAYFMSAETLEWDPVTEREVDFRARVDAYVTRRHVEASAGGLVPSTQSVEWARDAEWLVRYHVLEQTYSSIADSYVGPEAVGEDVVRKAVAALAKSIGLPLRPARRGRPKIRKQIPDSTS